MEGQRFEFKCDYRDDYGNNAKYFCYVTDYDECDHLIRTGKHNQWVTDGRFSLYDNTSKGLFIVRVNKLTSEDSGTYRCGVDVSFGFDDIFDIRLNVFQGTVSNVTAHNHYVICL